MAYITEIHYYDPHATATGVSEFVEIGLTAAEFARASDFDVDLYDSNASLGVSYNLGSLTPVFVDGLYVYTIYESLTFLTGAGNYSAFALADDGNLLDFYDIQGGTVVMPTTGIAAGATPTILPHFANNAIQFDAQGNVYNGPVTEGFHPYALCFTKGSLIATDFGERPIEDLKVGDRVMTADRGLQKIRWIGHRHLSEAELELSPHLRSVRIRKDKMGLGLPKRDLWLSPHHRVLSHSKIAERMFDTNEVLIDAKHLCDMTGVAREKKGDVDYYHILFDHHEIVYAEGLPCESLYTGEFAMKSLTAEGRREIEDIFPEILNPDHKAEFVRKSPSNKKQKDYVVRHIKKQRELLHKW